MRKILRKVNEDVWVLWAAGLYCLPFAFIFRAMERSALEWVPWHHQITWHDFVGSLVFGAIALCFCIAGIVMQVIKESLED